MVVGMIFTLHCKGAGEMKLKAFVGPKEKDKEAEVTFRLKEDVGDVEIEAIMPDGSIRNIAFFSADSGLIKLYLYQEGGGKGFFAYDEKGRVKIG